MFLYFSPVKPLLLECQTGHSLGGLVCHGRSMSYMPKYHPCVLSVSLLEKGVLSVRRFLREKTGSLLYDASSLHVIGCFLLPIARINYSPECSGLPDSESPRLSMVLGLLQQELTVGYCTDDQHVTIYN